MEIKSKEIKIVPVKVLKKKVKNRNHHPQDQIEALAKHFEYQGFRNPLIVSNQSGEIVCGNGRFLAALRAGLKELPVIYQDFDSPEQEYAYHVADNGLGLWAELDLSGINTDLPDLGPDFDIDMLGIKDFKLDLNEENDDENPYTRKVESPIYEPTGEKPKLSQLFDTSVSDKLIKEIEKSELPGEVKEFLRYASYRHVKFNYKNIAEYYAHAEEEEQNLIENSALVIIDFDKAIELGFVKMTKAIAEAYQNEL